MSEDSTFTLFLRVMLTSVVNNPFYESFDIIFMGNEKKYQNIIFFFFSHKNFLYADFREASESFHKHFPQ